MAAVTGAAALAFPAAALADGWAPIVDLSAPGQEASAPAAAMDPAGNATVVWTRGGGSSFIVQARQIRADGTLPAVQDLSAPGASADPAHVAVDPAGDAVVVWTRNLGTLADPQRLVQARRMAADGSLGPVLDLSPAGRNAGSAAVAIDQGGNVVVAWDDLGSPSVPMRMRRIGADGTVGPIADLAPPGSASPRLAPAPSGTVTAVWVTSDLVQGRRIAPDGAVGPILDLSASGAAVTSNVLAVDPDGNAIAVWQRGAVFGNLQARRISAGGSLGPIQDLTASGELGQAPDVAFDPSGTATVGFGLGSNASVQAVRIAPGGAPGARLELDPPASGGIGGPKLAVDAAGGSTAAWERLASPSFVRARRIEPGGALGESQVISAPDRETQEPAIAGEPAGNATVTWLADTGANRIVQARPFLRTPACEGTSASVANGGSASVSLRCSGLHLTRQIVAGPAHGSLGAIAQSAGTVTYTAAAGYGGPDSFTFKAVNGGGESATVTATLDVAAAPPIAAQQPPPVPPLLAGPASGRAAAALAGRTLRFKRGRARERATCQNVAGDECAISVTVRSGASGAARKRRRPKTLAKARARIPGGQTATLTWRLTAAGRRALRHRRATAQLTGTSRNRAGEAVRLTGRRTLTTARGRTR